MPGVAQLLMLAVVTAILLWRLAVWWKQPLQPNPWDEDTEARLHEPEAVLLCPRCLEPEREGVQFCRDCGFAVGPYVTWSPYLYIFVLGDLLRTGVDRPFRVKSTTVCFLLLVSLFEYFIFAPVYWFFLIRNIRRQPREHGLD